MGFVRRQTRLNRLNCGNKSLSVHISEQIEALKSEAGINVPVRRACWHCSAERQALQPSASANKTYLHSEGRCGGLVFSQRSDVAVVARKMYLPGGSAGTRSNREAARGCPALADGGGERTTHVHRCSPQTLICTW